MTEQIANLEHTLGSLETSFLLVSIPMVILLLVIVAAALMILFTVLRTQRESEQQLLSTLSALQKMQSTLSELLGEQRRTIRTMNELLALKQAEMTGDFEVVEEEIAQSRTVERPTNEPIPPKGKPIPMLKLD